MPIRKATYHDAPAIKQLLEELGYAARISLLVDQLENIFGKEDHQVLVYEERKEVLGFIAVHFMPQLAFEGNVAIIGYLSYDETDRTKMVGEALEQHVTSLAKRRRCDRIQVHCAEWRPAAHLFYRKQGYTEYPKYFTKYLLDGDN